jgi:hypothetical protein
MASHSSNRAGASQPAQHPRLGALVPAVVAVALVVLATTALVGGGGSTPTAVTGARVVAGSPDRAVVGTVQPPRAELRTSVSVLAVALSVALALFAVAAVLAPSRRAPRPRTVPVRGRAPPAPRVPHP